MSYIIRGAVSKKKRRYQKNGFDLDLTYVTPRIIAMGFPSESVEAAYRNPFKEVLRFLDSFHKDHYKVYNLCSERGYDPSKFYNRAEVFPFEDHNAPPFELILAFCQNVQQWLAADEKNIAVIHCKAGKGRTGLMICAWMLFSKEWSTANDALTFYAAMRTYNKKGVTIPSQIRYVHYFEETVHRPGPLPTKTLLLNRIVLHSPPKISANDINFVVHVGKTCVFSNKHHDDKGSLKEEKKEDKDKKEKKDKKKKGKGEDTDDGSRAEAQEKEITYDCPGIPLCGDIKINFKIFAFWFNTSFVKECRLVLHKEELDKAHKDKNHQKYPENFRVELLFTDMSTGASPDIAVKAESTNGEEGTNNDKDNDTDKKNDNNDNEKEKEHEKEKENDKESSSEAESSTNAKSTTEYP